MPVGRHLAATLAGLAALLTVPAAAIAADPGPYVALGDSYTAAPLVLNQVGEPAGCARSDHNYPSVVRAATDAARFADVSCSSATTVHMTAPQSVLGNGVNAPQFDALTDGARLVTIGIGGNDVGLVGAAVTCVRLGLTAPTGTACRSNFAKPGGGDRLVDQIAATASKIAATLEGIHSRSPKARVLIVGYPAVAPDDGRSCYPFVPMSADDIGYLDEMLVRTNAMLAAQAAANDAEYVDTYTDSIGHDVCKGLGERWFEGLIPTMPALPIHPNALGEASMARSVLGVLGRPRPGPVLSDLERARRTIRAGRAARFTFQLNRAGRVTFALRRSRGRKRYTGALRTIRVDADRGANRLTLTAQRIGRRAGLYRLTATPQDGASRVVHFRIRRAR